MKNLYASLLVTCSLIASLSSLAQIPVLNSYPSATATIYLDFDGHLLNGTSWNMNGPINCGPANIDTNKIREIFNRVSEDYRPFNINITTDSTRYWSAPATKRMRIVLTITSEWYGAAGGVSYVGSFTWGDNTPAFVFTALLGYNAKNIAEATAHEIGHTLGLRHQASYDANCVKTSEYNAGKGSGEIGWAPIMGVGYYKNFTLWNNGANPYGCTSYQDDLGIMTGVNNGFGYRADDHPDSAAGIMSVENVASVNSNWFHATGVIEKISDKDVFRITIPATGKFHLDAIPYNIGTGNTGSDLDMQVELLSSTQDILNVYNPEVLLSAIIDTTLNPGNYYLRVEGKGNVNAPEYASLGSYNLNGTFSASVPVSPIHFLDLHGLSENAVHKLNWAIEADDSIAQQVLEVSNDGINFQPLISLTGSARAYQYYFNNNNELTYYRLKISFYNSQTGYYSNIVSLPGSPGKSRPSVAGNLIQDRLAVNSPALFNYSVVDYNGRIILKGNIQQGVNSISTSLLSRGMYVIQFTNGPEFYAEKFMRQ